jgi:hypothetical protein
MPHPGLTPIHGALALARENIKTTTIVDTQGLTLKVNTSRVNDPSI